MVFKNDKQRRAVMSRLSQAGFKTRSGSKLTVDNIMPKDWVKTYDSKTNVQWDKIGGSKDDIYIMKPTYSVYIGKSKEILPFGNEQSALAFIKRNMRFIPDPSRAEL